MMRRPSASLRTSLLALTITTALLAGCVEEDIAGQSGATAASGGTSNRAEPGAFDEETGAVEGVVTTDDLQPLADAAVGLDGAHWTTTTAADGSFSFSMIPPGRYVLLAQKLGYEAAQASVQIVVGEVTTGVKVLLSPTPVVEPFVLGTMFEGYITCTVGAFGVLSEECGQGLQTDVGTYGRNANNKIDWLWNVTQVADLKTMLLELDWRPASAAANQLTLYVAHGFKCTPSCDEVEGGVNYCDTDNHGTPVQRCQIDDLKVKDPSTQLPWDMTARAWGAPVEATEVPNVVLEQGFTMYRTEFFGLPMPEGFSAAVDG